MPFTESCITYQSEWCSSEPRLKQATAISGKLWSPQQHSICLPGQNADAWFVLAPWEDPLISALIESSSILVISRSDGRLICEGSAGDEG